MSIFKSGKCRACGGTGWLEQRIYNGGGRLVRIERGMKCDTCHDQPLLLDNPFDFRELRALTLGWGMGLVIAVSVAYFDVTPWVGIPAIALGTFFVTSLLLE